MLLILCADFPCSFREAIGSRTGALLAPRRRERCWRPRNAGIELDYLVGIVVDPSGRVVSARPLNRAGYGLDEAALRAIADYRFSPASRAGRPVGVRMHWTVQFRLR